jgi:hypothetical protein
LLGARACRHAGVRTAVRADVDEYVLEEGHPNILADGVGVVTASTARVIAV